MPNRVAHRAVTGRPERRPMPGLGRQTSRQEIRQTGRIHELDGFHDRTLARQMEIYAGFLEGTGEKEGNSPVYCYREEEGEDV